MPTRRPTSKKNTLQETSNASDTFTRPCLRRYWRQIPALGAVVLIIRVDASVHDLGIRLDDPALQSGDSGDHLKGGAGGIDTLESTVQEGLEGISAVLRQIGRVGGQVIGGVGGGGQHLCPVHVHHHAGCALCVLTGQLGDSLGEDVLHLLLKVDVDGEHHVVPRLGGGRSTSRTPPCRWCSAPPPGPRRCPAGRTRKPARPPPCRQCRPSHSPACRPRPDPGPYMHPSSQWPPPGPADGQRIRCCRCRTVAASISTPERPCSFTLEMKSMSTPSAKT